MTIKDEKKAVAERLAPILKTWVDEMKRRRGWSMYRCAVELDTSYDRLKVLVEGQGCPSVGLLAVICRMAGIDPCVVLDVDFDPEQAASPSLVAWAVTRDERDPRDAAKGLLKDVCTDARLASVDGERSLTERQCALYLAERLELAI